MKMAEVHTWARHVADTIHGFYLKAADLLDEEHEGEWCEGRWYGDDYYMVELHLFALQRLSEWRASHPKDSHIALHEFFEARTNPQDFADDYWENRDPALSNRAQHLIHKNDWGKPLARPERVAQEIIAAYGDAWVDLPDEEFKEAWEWQWLVDADTNPRISWEEDDKA
jgi:hypothetical protein